MPESSSTNPITALTQAFADLVGRVEKLEKIQEGQKIKYTPEQEVLRAQFSMVGQLMGYGVPAPAAVEMVGFQVEPDLFEIGNPMEMLPAPLEGEEDDFIEGVDDLEEIEPEKGEEDDEGEQASQQSGNQGQARTRQL